MWDTEAEYSFFGYHHQAQGVKYDRHAGSPEYPLCTKDERTYRVAVSASPKYPPPLCDQMQLFYVLCGQQGPPLVPSLLFPRFLCGKSYQPSDVP
jgi:hypothetical protein